MTIKQRVLKLWNRGNGMGVRAIAREVDRSAMQVSRIIAAASPVEPATNVTDLLAQLASAVQSFAVEREGRVWKIVNYELPLGAEKETAVHADLRLALREALSLWQV